MFLVFTFLYKKTKNDQLVEYMKQFLRIFKLNAVHNYAGLFTMISELRTHETLIVSQM